MALKRVLWVPRDWDRMQSLSAVEFDAYLRDLDASLLPAGLPIEGWKRENGRLVELSSEQFPGSTPVWIWEEA